MATFTQLLKDILTPDLISKASSLLGENEGKVEVAAQSTLTSILGGLIDKGSDSSLESLFLNASNDDLSSNISKLFSGALDEKTKGAGNALISTLFGDKMSDVVATIATQSGISKDNATKLMSMLAPLVAGFLGGKLKSGGGLAALLGAFAKDQVFLSLAGASTAVKSSFPWIKVLIPAVLALLGLFYMVGRDKGSSEVSPVKATVAVKPPVKIEPKVVEAIETIPVEAEVIKNTDDVENSVTSEEIVEITEPTRIDSVIEDVKGLVDIQLPNGAVLKGYKFGIEARILGFLKSDEYVLMTNEELKNHWFDFDNLNFEFGSGTKITADSEAQIQNIVAILDNFKDSSIKIGAYTDAKGDQAFNLKLSQERAHTIQQLLIAAGAPKARIVGAEGYGSEFATASAMASDEERAKDRRVAIRFEHQE